MLIKWSPQRSDATLVLSKQGQVLTLNGETFDFSFMQSGDELPAKAVQSSWFVDGSTVKMVGGELQLSLVLPLPYNYTPAQAFPSDTTVTTDGSVALPGAA